MARLLRSRKRRANNDSTTFRALVGFNHRCWGFRFLPTGAVGDFPCKQDHTAWLTHVLEKMETIKPGMTRWDLLHVFRTDGGLRWTDAGPATGLRETFVSQDFPHFKIDVEFKRVDGPQGLTMSFDLSNQDVIVKVSKPYVQFATMN